MNLFREGDKEVSMTEMKVRMSSPVIPGKDYRVLPGGPS